MKGGEAKKKKKKKFFFFFFFFFFFVKLGIFCLELGKNILFGIGNGAEFRPQNRVIESPVYMYCPAVYKIIHSLKLVDYLHVQADNPWYNYYISTS